MVSEIAEQYLKVVYNLTEDGGVAKTSDVAKAMGVAPASVTEMLQKLSKQGYLKHEKYKGATLKPKGLKIARQVTRKHRLLERFLNDLCGIRGKARHAQACKMEHVLTDDAERQLCRMLEPPVRVPAREAHPQVRARDRVREVHQGDGPAGRPRRGRCRHCLAPRVQGQGRAVPHTRDGVRPRERGAGWRRRCPWEAP